MRSGSRRLTAEEEAFYAGFTHLRVIQAEPYAAGEFVDIIGDHPHSGKRGTIAAIEANPADRLLGRSPVREALRVSLSDGMECFVMEPRHVRRATCLTR